MPEETTTTPVPEETTTSTASTTSTTEPDSPPTVTTAPPGGGDTTPGTTSQPTTSIPEGPTIDDATLAGAPADRVTVSNCSDRVKIQALVRNAEYVQVVVRGTGLDAAMTGDGDSYSFTLVSGPSQWVAGDVGTHEVVVLAGSGDAVVERSVGTTEVPLNCPKD